MIVRQSDLGDGFGPDFSSTLTDIVKPDSGVVDILGYRIDGKVFWAGIAFATLGFFLLRKKR